MIDNTIKTFIFTRTVHTGNNEKETDTWEYHGTEAGASKEFQDILMRSFSPFVTFNYQEKVVSTSDLEK